VRPERAACSLSLALLALAVPARAELPANGDSIRTHDYTIDLSQTAVLAGTRVTGLSGAFVALGEGVDGIAQNPGAVALRVPWSRDHIDYDLGLGLTFSSSLARSDVFNSGRRTVLSPHGVESLAFLNLAANLQVGRWGFGLSTDLQEYSLDRSSTPSETQQQDRLVARFAVTHATIGYAFHEQEVLVGLGARWNALNVLNANAPAGAQENLFEAIGSGFEAGVLLRPNDTQYRAGVCVRSAVRSNASPSSRVRVVYPGDPENELFLPDHVMLPWELNAGFAVQFGPRPFNPRWLDASLELEPVRRYLEWRERERLRRHAQALDRAERAGFDLEAAMRAVDAELRTEAAIDALHLARAERELDQRLRRRYQGMDRFNVLVSASFDILGPVSDGVGVESFLERKVQRSGKSVSISPRLGVETEAIPHWLRLRAGSYIEPTRFDNNPRGSRTHWTVGLDQRLFPWEVFGLWAEGSIWRVSGSLDVAREYFSWGVAIGMWH
jgi:hypothetical protein